MVNPVLAARIAVSMLLDKKNRKWALPLLLVPLLVVFLLLLLPLTALAGIVLMLNPIGKELQTDVYFLAIGYVRAQYSIENDLPVQLVKTIDLIYTGDLSQDSGYAKAFVADNFVSSYEDERRVPDGVDVMGNPKYTTTKTTVYYFTDATEMLAKIQLAPYSFSAADVRAVQGLYFDAEGGLGMAYEGKYPMPVAGYISSGYGNRVDPLNGKYFLHPAVDIVPEWHASVSAIADGEVTAVVTDEVYGNNVTIKHTADDHSFYTFSAHLSRVDVTVGQQIAQGEVIGLEGGDQEHDPNPGRTTGHHLHFEIWETPDRSGSVNPARYLHE